MAITWTVVVFGALLHGIKCNSTMQSPVSLLNSTSAASQVSTPPTTLGSAGSNDSISTTNMNSQDNVPNIPTASTTLESTVSRDPTLTASPVSTRSPDSTTRTSLESTGKTDSTPPTSVYPTNSSSNLTTKEPPLQQNANDSSTLTEHNTTQNTAKIQPSTSATLTVSNHSPQNSPTVISSANQVTTNSSILVTTTHNENGKTPLNQTNPSAVTTNSAPYSKSTASQSIQTTEAQTTSAPITTALHPGHLDSATTTSTPGKITYESFNLSSSIEGNVLLETCKRLVHNSKGNCLVSLEIQNKTLVATIKIIVTDDQEIQTEIDKQGEEEHKESIPDTLVAILASSGALVLILCCFAAYCTYHRRSYRKNQQHLTEELQTVENGYHDNPTLEVMEVVPEMQEKKLALNGEFNDSWIVPIDNLLKDDIPDEEDTHL